LEVLRYIRDNFSRALDQEAADGRAAAIKNLLANSDLIAASDGGLRAASRLFVPSNDDAIVQLGALAVFPDMDVYAAGRDAWMTFFLSLGLKQEVRATDLLARIASLTSRPPSRENRRTIQRIFAFIQKHWDALSVQFLGERDSKVVFATALKDSAWLPAVQDDTAFPGFHKPEDRWYRLDELYPRSLGHRVCSQAPLFDGPDPAGSVQTALGMAASPPLDLVTAHFDRLRELWADEGEIVDVAALTTSLKQVYTFFGQQSRVKRGALTVGAPLNKRYEDVPCIWDLSRRRFVRPRDCFSERVPYFEPHKVFVGGEPQVQAGRNVSTTLRQPSVEFKLGFLEFSSVN
jgi:hypothetical protein